MNVQGVAIGLAAFLIIGAFHPIVVKAEYHVGKRIWPLFLVVGLLLIAWSLFIDNGILSAVVGVTGFSSLWSIREVIEQEERVGRGWFPSNPNKKR